MPGPRRQIGGEVPYLLFGKIDVLIDIEGKVQRIPLRPNAPGTALAAGAWHWTVVRAPGRLMFITWAEETEYRPL